MNEAGTAIQRYAIQAWSANAWQELATGSTIGSEKVHVLGAVTASKLRIQILDAEEPASIAELKVNYLKQ